MFSVVYNNKKLLSFSVHMDEALPDWGVHASPPPFVTKGYTYCDYLFASVSEYLAKKNNLPLEE